MIYLWIRKKGANVGKMKDKWAEEEEYWNMWEYEFYYACKEEMINKNKGKKDAIHNSGSRSSISKRQRRK